jgi:hypothetical protein
VYVQVAHGHIASTEDQEEEDGLVEVIVTRDELSCPISLKLMTDPVVADDGHTYQRDAIEAWILKCITGKECRAQGILRLNNSSELFVHLALTLTHQSTL